MLLRRLHNLNLDIGLRWRYQGSKFLDLDVWFAVCVTFGESGGMGAGFAGVDVNLTSPRRVLRTSFKRILGPRAVGCEACGPRHSNLFYRHVFNPVGSCRYGYNGCGHVECGNVIYSHYNIRIARGGIHHRHSNRVRLIIPITRV